MVDGARFLPANVTISKVVASLWSSEKRQLVPQYFEVGVGGRGCVWAGIELPPAWEQLGRKGRQGREEGQWQCLGHQTRGSWCRSTSRWGQEGGRNRRGTGNERHLGRGEGDGRVGEGGKGSGVAEVIQKDAAGSTQHECEELAA